MERAPENTLTHASVVLVLPGIVQERYPTNAEQPPGGRSEAPGHQLAGDVGWHVLMAARNREEVATAGLIGRRLDAYSPTFRKSVRRAYNRRGAVLRPLFPGYVFVRLPIEPGVMHRRARDVPGVIDFLRLEPERYAIIPAVAILAIRAKEAGIAGYAPAPTVKPGDVVQLDTDPWRGHLGSIEKLSPTGRVKVLMTILGRTVRVDVAVDKIKRPL